MELFWTPASPFTRKVCVAARELGLWEQIRVRPTTWPHEWGYATVRFTEGLAENNPVARIPTLVTDAGVPLGDSTLACLHLNSLSTDSALIPVGDAAWPMWSLYGVADGLIEAQIAMRAEFLRPNEQRSESFLTKQRERIGRCFDSLEASAADLGAEVTLATITIGIACGYQIWREWLDPFETRCPALAQWYGEFARRPSMIATEPAETPQA